MNLMVGVTMKAKILMAAMIAATLGWNAQALAQDEREAVNMNVEQRDFVLAEMSDFLGALQDIVLAISNNDMASVSEASHAMGVGMGQGAGRPMGLNSVLPLEFRQIARSTHMGFSELAQTAEFGPEGLLADLATLMSNCTRCHASYKIVTIP